MLWSVLESAARSVCCRTWFWWDGWFKADRRRFRTNAARIQTFEIPCEDNAKFAGLDRAEDGVTYGKDALARRNNLICGPKASSPPIPLPTKIHMIRISLSTRRASNKGSAEKDGCSAGMALIRTPCSAFTKGIDSLPAPAVLGIAVKRVDLKERGVPIRQRDVCLAWDDFENSDNLVGPCSRRITESHRV